MKKSKRNLISIATVASITPIIATVACGLTVNKSSTVDSSKKVVIGYWPDLDLALSLNVNVAKSALRGSSNTQPGVYPAWFKGTSLEKRAENVQSSKALWDADTMDEEYWRNLMDGDEYVLAYEAWIKQPQKDFVAGDNKIHAAEFDYNNGIQGEEYYWQNTNSTDEFVFSNKTAKNYEDPKKLWEIRDMGAITTYAAQSLDKVYGVHTFSDQAEKVKSVTNNHWNELRKLQEGSNTSFKPIDISAKSWKSEDSNTENLLVVSLPNTLNGEAASISLATMSVQKELYTKAHFSMPELTSKQATELRKQESVSGNEFKLTSPTGNGVQFKNLSEDFFNDWQGKIDKIIIGMPYVVSESDKTIQAIKAKYSTTLDRMVKGGMTETNSLIVDSNLAGGSAYGFRMPAGQNSIIDSIAKQWYGAHDNDAVLKWEF